MMTTVTILALIYIHMQMQIFALAYQGKNREKQITKIKEINGVLAYDILELKSSNHLGVKLLAENSNLKFRDPASVVELVTNRPINEAKEVRVAQAKNSNPLLSFLSLKSQAEAEAKAEEGTTKQPWLRFR
jgi:hypothetical protein